ncbi:acetate--CoA ligase family protein [Porphyromonas pogonae]|uniref:acetate--CoA ligase family protein n=1 Tax=Porphyromonas pogonae TaxID=867595 RepID=UPI002E7A4559|nr:acetate--CoA ligase family protein [Porphyromonas pogonae]
MITLQLVDPKSIAVIGASDNLQKPGGKVLYNLKRGTFAGNLFAVNPNATAVQGTDTFKEVSLLPQTDLAILAIPAKLCLDTMRVLLEEKGTKAVIVLSAGFSEMGAEGKRLEHAMCELADKHHATLIGPNCVGVMNPLHQSVFTTPVPRLEWDGATLISSSGATCVFIMESALSKGLKFSAVYSVGNAAHTCVEDVLEYINENYDATKDSKTILMYIESVKKPEKLQKNAAELIAKGCRIAAVKSGTSDAGGRAAASHTGAMLNSDMAVEALFRKSGIIRCHSRGELTAVGAVMQHPRLQGKNIGIITHAGGPAVILTDVLSNGGLEVPHLPEAETATLLEKLFDGSSVANPIDILATGTAEQLQECIRFCDRELDMIDGIVVIFGSPGLFSNADAYHVILREQAQSTKPIYAVLPSIINAKEDMDMFVKEGGVFFEDEAVLGNALVKDRTYTEPGKHILTTHPHVARIHEIVTGREGLLPTPLALELLDLAGIKRPQEAIVNSADETLAAARELGFPLAMKVVGPAHKSEVGGVILNVDSMDVITPNYEHLMAIAGAEGVQMSQMVSGIEVFIGVKKEPGFGHLITCGLGGIFVEVIKDIRYALAPINHEEALNMVRSLKSYPIIRGIRGKKGIDEQVIADTLCKVSDLLLAAPEIEEMDINPLMGCEQQLAAVDVVVKL